MVTGQPAAHGDLELEDLGAELADEAVENLLRAAAERVEHDGGLEAVGVLGRDLHGILVLQAVEDTLEKDGLLDAVLVHDAEQGLAEELLVAVALGDNAELLARRPAAVAVAERAQLTSLSHRADVVEDVRVPVDHFHGALQSQYLLVYVPPREGAARARSCA